MKTNHLFYTIAAISVTVILHPFPSSVAYSAPTDPENESVTNIYNVTNSISIKTNSNVSDATNILYHTIIDQQLGRYAFVNTNREVVTLKDKAGNIIWSTNIVEGIKNMSINGEKKITGMLVYKGDLCVRMGKGYVVIDLNNGGIKGFESN